MTTMEMCTMWCKNTRDDPRECCTLMMIQIQIQICIGTPLKAFQYLFTMFFFRGIYGLL